MRAALANRRTAGNFMACAEDLGAKGMKTVLEIDTQAPHAPSCHMLRSLLTAMQPAVLSNAARRARRVRST